MIDRNLGWFKFTLFHIKIKFFPALIPSLPGRVLDSRFLSFSSYVWVSWIFSIHFYDFGLRFYLMCFIDFKLVHWVTYLSVYLSIFWSGNQSVFEWFRTALVFLIFAWSDGSIRVSKRCRHVLEKNSNLDQMTKTSRQTIRSNSFAIMLQLKVCKNMTISFQKNKIVNIYWLSKALVWWKLLLLKSNNNFLLNADKSDTDMSVLGIFLLLFVDCVQTRESWEYIQSSLNMYTGHRSSKCHEHGIEPFEGSDSCRHGPSVSILLMPIRRCEERE